MKICLQTLTFLPERWRNDGFLSDSCGPIETCEHGRTRHRRVLSCTHGARRRRRRRLAARVYAANVYVLKAQTVERGHGRGRLRRRSVSSRPSRDDDEIDVAKSKERTGANTTNDDTDGAASLKTIKRCTVTTNIQVVG